MQSGGKMTLDEIGIRFETDKSSKHHNYLQFYEQFFSGRRNDEIKFLEIGIFQGASLKTWQEYFPNARIVGVDIRPETRKFASERTVIEIVDQSNIDQLVRLGVKHGPFDIVVEDGSHRWEHQITSLRTLFPFVREGGLYIIEDLQTNFGQFEEKFREVASISCVEYLKKALDLRVADGALDIHKVEDAFLRTYARSMNLMFSKHLCLIQKLAIAAPK
jgi:hypothetical protein